MSYQNLRGKVAQEISIAMGIDEPSGIAQTGYLVEVRRASDHFRLSAHALTYFKEVLIYDDRRLDVIEIDTLAGTALKTSYTGDTIITLSAPWNASTGYEKPYRVQSTERGVVNKSEEQWEKYDALLMRTEIKLPSPK